MSNEYNVSFLYPGCFFFLSVLSPRLALSQSQDQATRRTLDLPKPIEMRIVQRPTDFIPGSNQSLRLEIGDITGTMVLVSILDNQSKPVMRETPICLSESVQFEVNAHKFTLTLTNLDNRLIGDDSAVFELGQGDVKNAAVATSNYGDSIKTSACDRLNFHRLTKRGWVEMRLGKQEFALQPGDWCWLTQDEILKIISASETKVVYRLYQPAPWTRPF